MTFSVIQALFAFLLVVAAIPFALALVRRSRAIGGQGQVLRLAGGLALGPRERIAVVEVGGRWLVVGVTGQAIQLLATLDEPPPVLTGPSTGAVGAAASTRLAGHPTFARLFAKARERQGR